MHFDHGQESDEASGTHLAFINALCFFGLHVQL